MGTRKFELPGIQDLTKEQELVRALPKQGQHLIVGGPGTGKSVIALLRAWRLAQDREPYVFLVYNHLLHRASRQLFGEDLSGKTWMSWFMGLFQRTMGQQVPRLPAERGSFPPIDWKSVLRIARERGEPRNLTKPFLVIDEGQDMPPAFYEFLVEIGFEDFFVACDQNQQIIDNNNSSRQDIQNCLGLDVAEVIELSGNHRNAYPVARLAREFYTGDPASPPLDLPPSSRANVPTLYVYDPSSHGLDNVARNILQWVDRQPNKLIGVIAPDNEVRDRYLEALWSAVKDEDFSLTNAPPSIETFHKEYRPDVAFDQGGILVINAQSCKGLEFDDVVLADIDQHYILDDDLDITRKLFYVMVSRARENVFMFQQQGKTSRVEAILPDDTSILSREPFGDGAIYSEPQGSMMADSLQSLFDESSSTATAPENGYLVTNHLNLMYMLSGGLIMPPEGFGQKYYQDTLGCFPGWIPLFINKIFDAAVEASVSEAAHLRPCLAEIQLHGLAGSVWVLREKDVVAINFPAELDGTEQIIFVPAPLPTARIERIVFQSQAEVTATNREVRDYNNVPWTDFPCKAVKKPFNQALKAAWPPPSSLPERAASLVTPLAAGGSMAMVFHMANRSDLGVQLWRQAFDPDAGNGVQGGASLLAGFGPWLRHGASPRDGDLSEIPFDAAGTQELQRRLYWGLVDQVAGYHFAAQATSPEDVVLTYLEAQAEQLQEERLRQKLMELLQVLEDLLGMGAMETTEILELFPSPFSRALTLFFLRQDCAQLLEFQHPLLTEEDWLAAALLFGVRSGWQALPLDLRRMKGLGPAISHRMAVLAQRSTQTNLELGTPPARPQPLREAFMGDWTRRCQEAARWLAQKQGWDCLQTTLDLRNGRYEVRGDRGGIQIVMQGEPGITYTVNQDRFLHHLANERIADKVEADVYKLLGI